MARSPALQQGAVDLEDPDNLFDLGVQLDDQGRYEEAADAYRKSIAFSGSGSAPAGAWLNLGHALRGAGQLEEAADAWEQACRCFDTSALRSSAVVLARGEVDFGPDAAGASRAARAFRALGAFEPAVLEICGLPVGATGPELHRLRHDPTVDAWEDVERAGGTAATMKQKMFTRLFCLGCAEATSDVASILGDDATEDLMACGLLAKILAGTFCIGAVQVFPFRGLLLMTDWPSQTLGPPGEPVMSIGTDSIELCCCLGDGPGADSIVTGSHVLDLCTGSGIAAIHAVACGASRAVAVDVSPRACAFAAANAVLNGAELEVRQGDLYGALAEKKLHRDFDLVIANPPFVAAPPPCQVRRQPTLFVDGGADGLAVTRRILEGAVALRKVGGCVLRPGGSCVLVAEFPGLFVDAGECGMADEQRMISPQLASHLSDAVLLFADKHRQSAEEYAQDRAAPGAVEAWLASLRSDGVESMTSGIFAVRLAGGEGEGGAGNRGLRLVRWEAEDADQSWTSAAQREMGLQVVRGELARVLEREWLRHPLSST